MYGCVIPLLLACSVIGSLGICLPGNYYDSSTSSCQRCPRGWYKTVPGNNVTCTRCPSTSYGYSRTTLYPGAKHVDECYSEPIVDSIDPDHGPVSGGTRVQISLKHWEKDNVTYIYMGNGKCNIVDQSREDGTVTCITESVSNTDSDIAMVTFDSDSMITSTILFSYKSDPVVYSVDRYKTIVSGGLLIKVFGDNFTSVSHVYFQVTRIHRGQNRTFYEPCTIVTDQLLHCRTPNVGVGMVHHLFNDASRRKRSTTPIPTLNDQDNEFYGGLAMDGVTKFQNLSRDLKDVGQLLVYPDPVFYPFEEPDRVKKHDPEENEFLDILGKHLNYAATVEDMLVTVGLSGCNITLLATNLLTCRPPLHKPPLGVTYGPGKSPAVTVFVGLNVIYMVGYLDYSKNVVNEVIVGAAIGGGIFLILILIILLLLLIRRRKKREGFKDINANVATNEIVPSKIRKKRYVDSPVLSVDVNLKQGQIVASDLPIKELPAYGGTLPTPTTTSTTARGRGMSWTISPPGTPGDCSVTFDDNSNPFYFNYSADGSHGNEDAAQMDVLLELEESLMLNVKECLLSPDTLCIQEVIGNGFFGKVHRGYLLRGEDEKEAVAVKTIQGNHFSTKEVGAFLEEAVLMRDFNHTNVLSLVGVEIKNNRPFVVLPIMDHGDLKTYIKDPAKSIKVKELLAFGLQIASGMSYLARQKFVHRDLATRNCMLNKELVVKIADFGLSRDVYKSDYYRVEDRHRALPVRWMALESLTTGIFSSKSDVWSFGVVLWELLTRGCSPYPDVDTFNIKDYVTSGRRLSQPDHAPDQVFAVMSRCWLDDPGARPTFDELFEEIDDILSEDTKGHRPEYAKLVLPM